MPKKSNSVLKINIYAALSVIFIISYFTFVAGTIIGKERGIITGKELAENKPFIELVDMIKEQSSVFVVQKNDVAYLERTKSVKYLQGGEQ